MEKVTANGSRQSSVAYKGSGARQVLQEIPVLTLCRVALLGLCCHSEKNFPCPAVAPEPRSPELTHLAWSWASNREAWVNKNKSSSFYEWRGCLLRTNSWLLQANLEGSGLGSWLDAGILYSNPTLSESWLGKLRYAYKLVSLRHIKWPTLAQF